MLLALAVLHALGLWVGGAANTVEHVLLDEAVEREERKAFIDADPSGGGAATTCADKLYNSGKADAVAGVGMAGHSSCSKHIGANTKLSSVAPQQDTRACFNMESVLIAICFSIPLLFLYNVLNIYTAGVRDEGVTADTTAEGGGDSSGGSQGGHHGTKDDGKNHHHRGHGLGDHHQNEFALAARGARVVGIGQAAAARSSGSRDASSWLLPPHTHCEA